nr:probable inactive serine/threonine-protein kinase fnkC [Ipomoea batatas]
MFKIQSVSSFAEHKIEKYTSPPFEAGGYKWKLIFYPKGNTRKGVTDHISMHLAMADTSCFQPGWEVHAVFRLFLLHQNNDTYLVIRDAQEKGRRFRETRTEWGFDRIVPTKMFHNGSYGFVVDDECVFGSRWFDPSSPKSSFHEWPKVITQEYFKTPTAGFWSDSKDECTIEAEVRVHGVTTPLLS